MCFCSMENQTAGHTSDVSTACTTAADMSILQNHTLLHAHLSLLAPRQFVSTFLYLHRNTDTHTRFISEVIILLHSIIHYYTLFYTQIATIVFTYETIGFLYLNGINEDYMYRFCLFILLAGT